MAIKLPDCYNAGDTIPIMFDTYDSNGASVTLMGLAVTDIEVFKGTSMTQRASDNGYALIDTDGIDLDSTTGLHGFSIDTSDNSDSGFWVNGNTYHININSVTVDSQTVRFTFVLALGYTLRPATKGRQVDIDSSGRMLLQPDQNQVTAVGGWAVDTTEPTVTVAAMQGGVIDAAALASDATTEIQNGLATAAELAKVPKSDSNVTWNATAAAQITTQATSALNTYDPPTHAEALAAAGLLYDEDTIDVVHGAADLEVSSGWANPDELVGAMVVIRDVNGANEYYVGTVVTTASAVRFTCTPTPNFTVEGGDTVRFYRQADTLGTTTLLTRVTSTLFSGITSLAQWLGAGFGKQTPNSTALTEINATGAGSGTYSATTDSQEAARDAMATASALATAQADLDILTGADGAVLATSQPYVAEFSEVMDDYGMDQVKAGVSEIKQATYDLAVFGEVDDDSATTTSFIGDSSLSDEDDYAGAAIVPLSGALKGIGRKIVAYNGATHEFTVDEPWTSALADETPFIILGRIV